MATSNSYNYTQDRDTIIRGAFEIVGVAVEGETLQDDDIAVANRALNAMLKAWIVHGLQVWKRKTYTITPLVLSQQYYDLGTHYATSCTYSSDGATAVTVTQNSHGYSTGDSVTIASAGDADANGTYTITVTDENIYTYTAGGTVTDSTDDGSTTATLQTAEKVLRPEKILEVERVGTDGTRVSMTQLTRQEYDDLPNVTTSGTPINYHYERRLGAGRFYIWPVADATSVSNDTIQIVYQSQIEDMDSSTDDLDMPQEWIEPTVYGLAYRLAQRYGMKGSERDRLRLDAEYMLKLAKDYDVEDGSIYFSPEVGRG